MKINDIWVDIRSLHKEYESLNLNATIDYEKYKLYSIVTNSTALEGSTLTDVDTQLLLDEGITAKGKSLEHHLMVKDNYDALKFSLKEADEKVFLSTDFLKELNSYNMATTGAVIDSLRGVVDGKKGEFRLVNAFSEALGYYLDASKIPDAVIRFCDKYNQQLQSKDLIEILQTSFSAHADLILIHPWQDGNKRTSRLLMNFIQRRADMPLTKVHKQDGKEYLKALKIYKDESDINPLIHFMGKQHIKTLTNEISTFKNRNKGMMMML